MPTTQAQHQARIDALMEQASASLVERRYFETERLCLDALARAHHIRDYDRLARILMPLQEARRHKRDLAADAKAVFVISDELPSGKGLVPGCYLIAPPRVGVDGRALREALDKKHVPAIVLTREPTSRDGLWPIVAVGPATIRAKVTPPLPPSSPHSAASQSTAAGSGKKKVQSRSAKKPSGAAAGENKPTVDVDGPALPTPQWFLTASEALGDAAIVLAMTRPSAAARVDALMEYLGAHPDHEKLHQRLEEAARQASREPASSRKSPALPPELDDGEDDDDDDLD